MATPWPLRAALLLLLLAICVEAKSKKPPGLERAQKADLPNWRPAELRLDRIRLPPGYGIEM